MLASHADVLRGSLRVPAPGTREEFLRTTTWEAVRTIVAKKLILSYFIYLFYYFATQNKLQLE